MEEPKWKIYAEFLQEIKEMALQNKKPVIKSHLFYEAIVMMADELIYLRAENERLRDKT